MTTQTRHEMHIFTQLHTCTCMVPFLKISRGRGLNEIPRGVKWGNTCMDISLPPPPKEKNIYIIYKFLAAHEYKIAAGLQGQN